MENSLDSEQAAFAAACQYQAQGNIEEAFRYYERVLTANPNHALTYFNLSQLFDSQGRGGEAIGSLHKAIEIEPTLVTPEVHCNLAAFFAQQGQTEDAIRLYKHAIELQYDLVEPRIQLANLYVTAGRFDDALNVYDQVFSLNPSLAEVTNKVHVNISIASKHHFIRQKKIEIANRIIKTPSRTPNLDPKAYGIFLEANSLIEQGKVSQAEVKYRAALSVSPNFQEALYNLASLLQGWGSIAGKEEKVLEAHNYFKELVSIDPTWSEAYVQAGLTVHSLHGIDPLHEAQQFYEKAVQVGPTNPEGYLHLMDSLQRQGEMSRSFSYLGTYLDLMNRKARSHPLGKAGVRFLTEDNTYAIGHLSYLPDFIKKRELLGWEEPVKAIILAAPHRVANRCLLEYWSEHFEVITDQSVIDTLAPLVRDLELPSSYGLLPNGKGVNARIAMSFVQREWERQNREPLLKLSKRDFERGSKILRKWGIPQDSWFVGLHVRDAAFKNEGDCIHNRHRNTDFSTYLPAIESIVSKGGWVIRLGEPGVAPLPPMKNVIDYAESDDKSDWMDVFLCAEARFLLASCSGVLCMAQAFGTPVAVTNFPPTNLLYGINDLFIPKLAYNGKEGRPVTFTEWFSAPIVECEQGSFFAKSGIAFIDNTSEEISELAGEMLERTGGGLNYSSEDESLQIKFRSLLSEEFGVFTSRIGRAFLRRHSNLLP